MSANQLPIKNDLEIRKNSCIASIKEGKWWTLQIIEPEMQDCEAVVLFSVERYGNTLKYASIYLQNNIYIVLAAIKENMNAFQFASDNLKKDPLLEIIASIDDDEKRARLCSKYEDMLSAGTLNKAKRSSNPTFFLPAEAIDLNKEEENKSFTP